MIFTYNVIYLQPLARHQFTAALHFNAYYPDANSHLLWSSAMADPSSSTFKNVSDGITTTVSIETLQLLDTSGYFIDFTDDVSLHADHIDAITFFE